MSEQPIAAFPPPAGLTMVGAADAGACVDGVCTVPVPQDDSEHTERDGSSLPGAQS